MKGIATMTGIATRFMAALVFALPLLWPLSVQAAEGLGGVAVRNLGAPGAFEVANPGGAASLSYQVRLQRLTNGAWSDETADLELVRQCNVPRAGRCATLGAGETLRPPPWNGLSCGSQCSASCRGNMMLPPGTFRFGVTACNGGATAFGPPFPMR